MKYDLTSRVFGRWTVVSRAPSRPDHTMWLCRCECGTQRDVYQASLINGTSKSCGCLHRQIMAAKKRQHGLHRSPEYSVWANMVQRCRNPRNKKFPYYGGRGISVCDEWRTSFENFFRDMGPRPSSIYSIDRIDNSLGYSPTNCRWGTKTEQANNTRIASRISYGGERRTLREWSEVTGISLEALRSRHKRRWSAEKMLTTPNLRAETGLDPTEVLKQQERAA